MSDIERYHPHQEVMISSANQVDQTRAASLPAVPRHVGSDQIFPVFRRRCEVKRIRAEIDVIDAGRDLLESQREYMLKGVEWARALNTVRMLSGILAEDVRVLEHQWNMAERQRELERRASQLSLHDVEREARLEDVLFQEKLELKRQQLRAEQARYEAIAAQHRWDQAEAEVGRDGHTGPPKRTESPSDLDAVGSYLGQVQKHLEALDEPDDQQRVLYDWVVRERARVAAIKKGG